MAASGSDRRRRCRRSVFALRRGPHTSSSRQTSALKAARLSGLRRCAGMDTAAGGGGRAGRGKRWTETLTVFCVFTFVLSTIFLSPVLYLALLWYPHTSWIAALYTVWYIVDRHTPDRGGRTVPCIKNASFWRIFADYFPVSVVKTTELDRSKNYLLCSYPHGFIPFGAFCGLSGVGGMALFPDMKTNLVSLSFNYWVPFAREVTMALGTVASSERSIVHLLRSPEGGQVVILVLGGQREQSFVHPNENHIILRRRTGFCRIALQEGISLVPSFTFGENRVNRFLHPFGERFSIPFLWPQRVSVTVVVGEPMPVKKIPNPSKEQILQLRQRFEDALVKLYKTYQPIYYPGEDVPLIIH